jgi:release factor glutamine methyltransferase
MTSSDPLVARLRAAGCVFAEEEAALLREASGDSVDLLEAMAARRIAGGPLETVVGWAEFAGIRVACAAGVFVPRRRTELMVRLAAGRLPAGATVLDLGCGTGAIGAAVAARAAGLEVWAVDVDPAAVDCARRNLPAERVLLGDLYEPLPGDLRFDVILANAPYVPTDEIALMPPEAREHEHRVALDGGPDGLDVQRRAIADARGRLVPGGAILVESGRRQSDTTASLMRAAGLAARVETDDDIGGTVVVGTL